MLVTLVVAALFGSDALVGLAERQELGQTRTVALQAAEGVDRVADFFSLDRPASAISALRGRDTTDVDLDELLTPPTGVATPRTTTREVSVEAPLDIYVGGDSMARAVGEGLLRQAPIELSTVELDFRELSGLSRPDFFDWPQRLAQEVADDPPDVVVLIFGTNDAQDIVVDGAVEEFGSDVWLAEYRSRVSFAMDLLGQGGVQVVWVGIPAMRDTNPAWTLANTGKPPFDIAMAQLDELYRSQAATRDWIHYVPTRQVFAGPDGGYTDSITRDDGTTVTVRLPDGMHWSIKGADLVGDLVWETIAETYGVASP